MLSAIRTFDKASLAPTVTTETSLIPPAAEPPPTKWVKGDGGRWHEVPALDSERHATEPARASAAPHELHGQCYGFEAERNAWSAPRLLYHSDQSARPGYDTLTASEYVDDDAVLDAKVARLAELLKRASCCVVYAGAGLSTAAGIDDYATRSGTASHTASHTADGLTEGTAEARAEADGAFRSPLCAQPTLSHRVLVGMHSAGLLHRLVQQNHDGLPQKAGMPQAAVNEIHGALHAPDNPVVPMSGTLRDDNIADLLECEKSADLTLAVGTSIAGMNADRLVHSASDRASRRDGLGCVIIGLQRTVADGHSTLRIFGRCDEVFGRLAEHMRLRDGKPLAAHVPPPRPRGCFFRPPVLETAGEDGYLLRSVPYDSMGRRGTPFALRMGISSVLDLREGARLAIPSGPHAGATGEVDGLDREGNVRIRFMLRLKKGGTFKAPSMLPLGTWWLQAAADGDVRQLPVVSVPAEGDASEAAAELQELCEAYRR